MGILNVSNTDIIIVNKLNYKYKNRNKKEFSINKISRKPNCNDYEFWKYVYEKELENIWFVLKNNISQYCNEYEISDDFFEKFCLFMYNNSSKYIDKKDFI